MSRFVGWDSPGVRVSGEKSNDMFIVSPDRFLPSFVTADVPKIWIIDGGLAVMLGKGGVDLPPHATGGL